jgi:hypothetical protein
MRVDWWSFFAGFVCGWGMYKLEKLFDRWEARARSRRKVI